MAAAVAKTHDPGLIKFLALAIPEWLPVENRLQRGDRTAGRGGHCKLCRSGAGDVRLAETVRHLFVCECPGMRLALGRLVADGCTALVGAGVRVRGPCVQPPVDVGWGAPASRTGRPRWIPVCSTPAISSGWRCWSGTSGMCLSTSGETRLAQSWVYCLDA